MDYRQTVTTADTLTDGICYMTLTMNAQDSSALFQTSGDAHTWYVVFVLFDDLMHLQCQQSAR